MSASSPHITLDDAREVERQVDKLIAEAPQLSHEHFAIDALGQLFAVSETLASLLEQFDAAVSALRDIKSAGHVGPEALSREGYMAMQALERLGGSNPASRQDA